MLQHCTYIFNNVLSYFADLVGVNLRYMSNVATPTVGRSEASCVGPNNHLRHLLRHVLMEIKPNIANAEGV